MSRERERERDFICTFFLCFLRCSSDVIDNITTSKERDIFWRGDTALIVAKTTSYRVNSQMNGIKNKQKVIKGQ